MCEQAHLKLNKRAEAADVWFLSPIPAPRRKHFSLQIILPRNQKVGQQEKCFHPRRFVRNTAEGLNIYFL